MPSSKVHLGRVLSWVSVRDYYLVRSFSMVLRYVKSHWKTSGTPGMKYRNGDFFQLIAYPEVKFVSHSPARSLECEDWVPSTSYQF